MKIDLDKVLVLDIETDSIENVKNVWCVVTRFSSKYMTYTEENYDDLKKDLDDRLNDGYWLVGHNVLGFDLPVLKEKLGIEWPTDRVIDTLIVSRLLNYNIEGGHSLEAWGVRLGERKKEFNDFSRFSERMLYYCIQDTKVTWKLFERFKPHIERFWKGVWLEHRSQEICLDMSKNGFRFDIDKALEYKKEIDETLDDLLSDMRSEIPPIEFFHREFEPKVTRDGKISKVGFSKFGDPSYRFYQADGWDLRRVYSPHDINTDKKVYVFRVEEFNPESTRHVLTKCWEWGWKPVNKTKGHIKAERDHDVEKLTHYKIWGWKIDEENLSTLSSSAPDVAHKLVEYLTLSSRRSMLEQWIDLHNDRTGRIHGTFLHIGAWTHRMAHRNPNMANIPSVDRDTPYAKEFRSLWCVEPGHLLLGCDADGIQMRIFAHYAEDDDLIHAILEGRKEDGTDVHSLHAKKLGGVERDKAKTFIYAWLLGAGIRKVAEILGCTLKEAEERVNEFLASYPKLMDLKRNKIPLFAAKGWFEAVDGSPIVCRSEHLMLAGMLQSGEAKAMKLANYLWRQWAQEQGIPFKQVNFVHDEWQTEVCTSDEEVADELGKLQAKAIETAGELLNIRCPLSGSYRIGTNWAETH